MTAEPFKISSMVAIRFCDLLVLSRRKWKGAAVHACMKMPSKIKKGLKVEQRQLVIDLWAKDLYAGRRPKRV